MINTKNSLEIVMSNITQFSRKLKLNNNKPECPDYLLISKITSNNINDQLYNYHNFSFFSNNYLFYYSLFNRSLTSVRQSYLTTEFSLQNSNFLVGLGVSSSSSFNIFFIYLACLWADSNNSDIVLSFGLNPLY